MNARKLATLGIVAIATAVPGTAALCAEPANHNTSASLLTSVREATRMFHDVSVAEAAGYGSMQTCVSGPQEGAMGIHYPNGPLIGDGVLDATRPEILIYEQRGARLRLVGVEFLILAADWDANNAGPPALMGQHFHYVGSPNRYRLPPFYELHVWAWRDNPSGTFTDWNPHVSCDEYTGEPAAHSARHGH